LPKLQTVERGRPSQRLALIPRRAVRGQRILLAGTDGQQGIPPQILVIVEIFITQGQPVNALGQQLLEPMFDKQRVARVAKTGGQSTHHAQTAIKLP
jgi:hypothetical protein